MDTIYIDAFERIALPIITLWGGSFWQKWRNKQKKEADILDNVKQILEMQSKYIADQEEDRKKNRDMIARLEAKLDKKNKSIRKANWCKYTNEGDGCPVLNEEERLEPSEPACDTCKLKPQNDDIS